jgi:hypothetical protein
MGYYRSIIISLLMIISFPLFYSLIFDLNFLETIFLPLKVASNTGIGPSDIMSLSRSIYSNNTYSSLVFVVFFNLLFILTLLYFTYRRKVSNYKIYLSSIVFSFVGFFHLGYDWFVLIILLFFMNDGRYKNLFYVTILIYFILPRILKFLFNSEQLVVEIFNNQCFIIINVVLLTILFFNILYDSKKETLLN